MTPETTGSAPGPGPDRSITRVDELTVALVATDRLRDSLAPVCEVLTPLDGDRSWLARDPDLLLVESSALSLGSDAAAERRSAVAELVGAAADAGVRSALWLSGTGDAQLAPEALLAAFDRVFVVHPYAADLVAGRTPQPPVVLIDAAGPRALEEPARTREGVAYVGGFSGHWPPNDKALVLDYLRAAADFDLRILARDEGEVADLPAPLGEHVVPLAGRDPIEELRHASALIAPLPTAQAESVAPHVLDAVAAEVLVVMQQNMTARLALPRQFEIAASGARVRQRLSWCLEPGEAQRARREIGRRTVLNSHTPAHRIATIASGLGYTVLPPGVRAGGS